MGIAKEGIRDQSKSYVGSRRNQGGEDEDGGVVDYAEVAVECHWPNWVPAQSESLTNWDRHHLHDLREIRAGKHGERWVKTYGKETNSLKAVALGR